MILLIATAWSAALTTVLYLFSTRMPWYQITSIKPVSLPSISLSTLEISADIEIVVEIENANFVGVEIHATYCDLYYPDWNGELRHIGDMTDKYDNANTGLMSNLFVWNSNENVTSVSDSNNGVKLPPRKSSTKPYNLLSIKNMSPSTYLNTIYNAIQSGGTIDMSFSLLAHVKSLVNENHSGLVPLTLGLMCNNKINTLSIVPQIVDRNCSIEFIQPGWVKDIQGKRNALKSEATKRHKKSGSVLHKDKRDIEMSAEEHERFLTWQEI